MGNLASPAQKNEVSLLDPGCGMAVLSCALIEPMIDSSQVDRISLILYETDKKVIPLTEQVLEYLSHWRLALYNDTLYCNR